MLDTSGWSVNRRQFLKSGLLAAAGVAALGPACVLGDDRSERTRWAFLADTHVAADPENRYRGFYPYRNLQEIAGQLACDLPDGMVIAGDLARLKGQIGAYKNLKALLAPILQHRPVYLGLGNHDQRDDFSHAFADSVGDVRTVEDKHVVAAVAGPMRLIVLDSLFANRMSGLLGQSQRMWLRDYLTACDMRPTILFLHHRPAIDLLDTRLLYEIIGPATQVKAVVYGHSHRFGFSEYKGIHLINLPATGYNMSGSQPVGWVEAGLTTRGGEFTLHALGGNRRHDGRTERLHWRS
jgi:3',5'-cyclic-AMP phosphodiesterase